jgi:hypothetical protein
MFNDNPDFFPTPKELVFKMLDKLNEENKHTIGGIRYILEPSAGKGNIIKYYKEYYDKQYSSYWSGKNRAEKDLTFDAIELDENLRNLLRGKGVNLVHDDFLTYEPQRFYDLIIMNPPFSDGDKHLLHAITNIQSRIGGKILCLLNAETLKNPYTNIRRDLLNKIKQYNGYIEYIDNAFSDAERETDVETAFVYIDVPMQKDETIFERHFKRDNPDIQVDNFQALLPKMSKLQQLVFECDMLKKSTIELFTEKMRVNKLLNNFGITFNISICETSYKAEPLTINEFINSANLKYWNKFIEETDFKKKLPSKLRDNFNYNMERQKDITFNMENVHYFYEQLIKSIPKSYEETVAKIFDDLTNKWSYTDSLWNKSVHYYDGWRTNNCYKVVGKSIIPYSTNYLYRVPDVLIDLNIIFNNIQGKQYNIDNKEVIDAIKNYEKDIDTEHFLLDSYKKGTIHIKYKDKKALEIFNILAGRSKNWLPPDFGQKKYTDMDEKEKQLVKEFGLSLQEYTLITLENNVNYLKLLN